MSSIFFVELSKRELRSEEVSLSRDFGVDFKKELPL